MGLDTEIKGSPASIRGAASWVKDTLAPAVDRGADAMVSARREAASEWRGDTGTAFCGAMQRGAREADKVHRGATDVATTLDDYAGTLQRCQGQMAGIRDEARGAGLTVSGFVIQSPGDGPPNPGTPPMLHSQAEVDRWNATVEAYNAHQEKIRTYNRLADRVDEVWRDMERAWERVSAKDRAMDGPSWAFTLSDVSGGLGGAALELHSSILSKDASYFKDLARENLERLRSVERVPPHSAARFYDDLDSFRQMGTSADDALANASRLGRVAKAAPVALGGALAVGGIFYDHYAGDESWGQAATSNLGGFGASVATGALVGTAIGGPVGTVVGTVVGAGVGVFTSGMIDGLWESGGDVSDAFMAGVDTLADTGEALVDGAADVGGAIVDGIGGLFD